MSNCTTCGVANREGARFCKACGAFIAFGDPLHAASTTIDPTSTEQASAEQASAEPEPDDFFAHNQASVAPSRAIPAPDSPGSLAQAVAGLAPDPAPLDFDNQSLDLPALVPFAVAEVEARPFEAEPAGIEAGAVTEEAAGALSAAAGLSSDKAEPSPQTGDEADGPGPGETPEDHAAPPDPVKTVAPPGDSAAAEDLAAAPERWTEGVWIADRFLVLGQRDAGEPSPRLLWVEDHDRCPACGSVVHGGADDQFCFECGASLVGTGLAWPVRALLLEQPSPDSAALPLVLEGVAVWIDAGAEELAASGVETALPLVLRAGFRSDVGVARAGAGNEDSLCCVTLHSMAAGIPGAAVGLYAVADGMGGHGYGHVASRRTIQILLETLLPGLLLPVAAGLKPDAALVRGHIKAALALANQRLVEENLLLGSDMGTTITLALVIGNRLCVANAGDSRTYLFESSGLRQITSDHSIVFDLWQQGQLEEHEIYSDERRNQIYRSLGLHAELKVDLFEEALPPGALLLLCCDGIWEMLHNEGIADILCQQLGDAQAICNELVKQANAAGGEDNLSVVVVQA